MKGIKIKLGKKKDQSPPEGDTVDKQGPLEPSIELQSESFVHGKLAKESLLGKRSKKVLLPEKKNFEIKKDTKLSSGLKDEKLGSLSFKYNFGEESIRKIRQAESENFEEKNTLNSIQTEKDLQNLTNEIWENLKSGQRIEASEKLNNLNRTIYTWRSGQLSAKMVSGDLGLQNGWQRTLGDHTDSEAKKRLAAKEYEDMDYITKMQKLQSKKLKQQTRVLGSCRFCLANGALKDYEILAMSERAYILQPKRSSFPGKHFMIFPFTHCDSTLKLDQEERAEVLKFRDCLTDYIKNYFQEDLDVIVTETAFQFEKAPHAFLEIFAIDREASLQAPMFFYKAFSDLGSEWDANRRIRELKREKGGIVKQIPKAMEFCSVEWAVDEGYVKIIDDWRDFDRSFIYEVIGSMMDLDVMVAKAPRELDEFTQREFARSFKERFKEYDWFYKNLVRE